jgi:hypothetical protein
MKVIEECVVFGKGRINYYPIMTEIVPYKRVMPLKKKIVLGICIVLD